MRQLEETRKPKVLPAETFWREMAFYESGPGLWKAIHVGLSAVFFFRMANLLGLREGALAEMLSIKLSMRRRWSKSGQLSRTESDLLYRIAEVFRDSLSLFEGDVSSAIMWLRTPATALNQIQPAALLTTHVGINLVKAHIGRIEHGVVG
ncbi:antitoxin Xre/MbcA/ParS toxin-binding domain-containing protein [Pseudomonas sp. DR48]|uniref:antitoxin Xre/MbcA/ParS toxin-binding domain-containing protein n=2 Tax=unclassified Pseudomonas TaxID=196821 RepID=UPI001C99EB59|nr:DUF2384 domain-containing protein [Pseudomonas sp. DR48]